MEGRVERTERGGAGESRSLLRVERMGGEARHFRAWLHRRAGSFDLEAGQRVRAMVRLSPLEPPLNPGQLDSRARESRRGVAARASLVGHSDVVLLTGPAPWRAWMAALHRRLTAEVERLAPSRDAAAFFLTLAAGQRAALGPDVEEAFARSGLAHVLSVSGLHVAALALITLAALRALLVRLGARWRSLDARRLAAGAAVPWVWAYVVFTGNQPPAVRSAVMASVVLLGLAVWRRADGLNSLAVAALLLVTVEPSSVAELSLQLSFLAVLSLILLTPPLRALLPWKRDEEAPPEGRLQRLLVSAREALLQTLCASLAVTLASLPAVASAFGRVSLAGLVSNIVCLPLSAVLTGLAAGGAALFVALPAAATPLLAAGVWLSELFVWTARAFAALPGASWALPSFSALAAGLYAAGLTLWALGEGRVRGAALLVPLSLASVTFAPGSLSEPGLQVTFLSVGHGDAIVLSSRGAHALVDGGGVPSGADTGARFVMPYLRDQAIRSLRLAVLSHPHPDHALGLISTLSQVPAEEVWLSEGSTAGPLSQGLLAAAARHAARVREVHAGHPSLQLGEATFEVLGPPRDAELLESVNDRSVVLLVRHGAVSILLTGDLEAEGEASVLEKLGPVTVLKAPHHGSRTSSTPPFVERVRPRYVVFCVGRRNRFGFPHSEVEARYRARGSECFRTDTDGAVTLESDGRDVRLHTYLPRERSRPSRQLATSEEHPHGEAHDF